MNAENLFDARLAIVRDADLETGRTRVLHDVFYEKFDEKRAIALDG